MPKPAWAKHGLTGLLALFSAAMVAPLLFVGKVYLFRDFGRFYYPVKELYLGSLRRGEFPLWSPEMNCGTPLHGELVHAFLYPPNAVLFLGAYPGWGLYFAGHLLLAGWGARRLALRFGAGAEAALATGFAFAGSGYLVSQLNHVPYASTAAWAPLIVSLVMDLAKRRASTVPWLAVCFTMAALAGEPFTLLLTVLFAAIVILAGFAGPRLPALLRSGLAGVIALLLAFPSLLPAVHQFGESIRSGGVTPHMEGYGSLHPVRFLTLLAPEGLGRIQVAFDPAIPFLDGHIEIAPPVLLAIHLGAVTLVAVLLTPLRRSRAAWLLFMVFVAAVLLSLGTHLGLATWLSTNVPGLDSFRYPDKYWFLATLAAALLVGVGIDRLRPRATVVVAALGAVAAVALGLAAHQTFGAVTGALSFALVAAAVWTSARWRTRILTAILAVELLFFGYRHHLMVDEIELSPMHPMGVGATMKRLHPGRIFVDLTFLPDRIVERVEETSVLRLQGLRSMSGVPHGFSYSIGYDPTEPLSRIPLFFTMSDGGEPEERHQRWHRVLRLAGTTHAVTTRDPGPDPEVKTMAWGPTGMRSLVYVRSIPRARLYGDAVWIAGPLAARDRVHDLSFDPFEVLVLEGSGDPESRGTPGGGARIVKDRPNRVRLEVRSDRPAWLLLADAWAPGWTAEVNGEPVSIEIGLVAFRAVRVPEGSSVVEFRYEPRWIEVVPYTTLLGLLLLVASQWWGISRRRRRSPPAHDS